MKRPAHYNVVMMMRLRKIQDRYDQDLEVIRKLYTDSFPADERIPFHILLKWLKTGCRLYVLEENGEPAGMIYVYVRDEAFMHYFAIREDLRGEGRGSQAISLLRKELDGKCLSLDMECADDVDSEQYRRLRFYQRLGFYRTEIRYRFFGVEYEILASEEGYSKERYMEFAKQVWGSRAKLIRYL